MVINQSQEGRAEIAEKMGHKYSSNVRETQSNSDQHQT